MGLGEDGPTHQPVEHLASLRAMPGLAVVRPADANETAQAWRAAVEAVGPVGLVLTRQDVPVLAGTAELAEEGVRRGGYVLADSEGAPRDRPGRHGQRGAALHGGGPDPGGRGSVGARVVSLPCWEWFEEQPDDYRAGVLPPGVPVLSTEAGSTFGWDRYADDAIGLDHFGASAPGGENMERFGFTADHVAERARDLLARNDGSDGPDRRDPSARKAGVSR